MNPRSGHWLPRCPVRLLVAAIVPAVACSHGDDWPRFLGPNGNGTSDETGLRLDWPPSGPDVSWARDLGASFSPPVVCCGCLIAFHRVDNQEVVLCADAVTGDELWTAAYPTDYTDRYRYNGGPAHPPR